MSKYTLKEFQAEYPTDERCLEQLMRVNYGGTAIVCPACGVDTKFQNAHRIWVVRNTEGIFVISAICTHLGCTPDWKASENKFKCPCHGSGYDPEGVNFEGPAPRPMDRAHVELDPSGEIVVDLSRLYRWPKGERSQFGDAGAILRQLDDDTLDVVDVELVLAHEREERIERRLNGIADGVELDPGFGDEKTAAQPGDHFLKPSPIPLPRVPCTFYPFHLGT